MFCLISLKTVWKENYYDSFPISMSGETVSLELSSKILSTDQIVKESWKFNIARIARGKKVIFCKWVTSKLTLVWHG